MRRRHADTTIPLHPYWFYLATGVVTSDIIAVMIFGLAGVTDFLFPFQR